MRSRHLGGGPASPCAGGRGTRAGNHEGVIILFDCARRLSFVEPAAERGEASRAELQQLDRVFFDCARRLSFVEPAAGREGIKR